MRQIADTANRGKMSTPADRKVAEKGRRSLAKGLFAGLVAGVAATVAKSIVESFQASRGRSQRERGESLAPKLEAEERSEALVQSSSSALHWGVGAAAGAAYGAVAEYFPEVTHQNGASFGLLIMALNEAGALVDKEVHSPISEEQEKTAASYALFGVVAERTRRIARGILQ